MPPIENQTKSAPLAGGLRRLRQGQLNEPGKKRTTAITGYEQFAAELDSAINEAEASEQSIAVIRVQHRELPGSAELGGRRRPVDDEISKRLLEINAAMRMFAVSRSELVAFIPIVRRAEGEEVLRAVVASLTSPITVDDLPYYLSPTAGCALLDRENATVPLLIDAAGLALGETDMAQSTVMFHPYQRVRHGRQDALERSLREAILDNTTDTAIQPSIDLHTGQIVGFEAFARWFKDGRSQANPTEFVALAESLGMLHLLTRQVLERVLEATIGWLDDGTLTNIPDGLTVWANVQPNEVIHPEFFPTMANLIGRDDRVRIGIELSPSPAGDAREIYEVIKPLVAKGARAAIGDFGIGQANLSILEQLPFDSVKLDRSLIHQINGNDRASDLVASLLDLAEILGLEATAQGIETEEQAKTLRSLGCKIGQGFHFVTPAPRDELGPVLAEICRKSRRAADRL